MRWVSMCNTIVCTSRVKWTKSLVCTSPLTCIHLLTTVQGNNTIRRQEIELKILHENNVIWGMCGLLGLGEFESNRGNTSQEDSAWKCSKLTLTTWVESLEYTRWKKKTDPSKLSSCFQCCALSPDFQLYASARTGYPHLPIDE